MNSKNLLLKFSFVALLLPIGLIVGAILLVRSRPSLLDLRGGHRLVFEIPVDANTPDDLAERIIKVLRYRIDPDGHYGLEWRALDKGRFEVLIPLAREESLDRFRWDTLEEMCGYDLFSIRAILAHALKIQIANRWATMDEESGIAAADSLVNRDPDAGGTEE